MEQQVRNTKDLSKSALLALLLSLWLYWLWSRRALYRFALTHPGSFGFPIVGSFHVIKDLKSGIFKGFDILFERCKSTNICVWLGLHPAIIISDPELIEKVLSSPTLLNKGKSIYTPIYQAFRGGIVSSPAHVWQPIRKIINPAFNRNVLVSFLPIFNEGKNVLLSKLDKMVDNGEHNLYGALHYSVSGIAAQTTMGWTRKPSEVYMFTQAISDLGYIMEKIILHIMMSSVNVGPLFTLHFKVRKHLNRLYEFASKTVNRRFQELESQSLSQTGPIQENCGEALTKPRNIFIDLAIASYQKKKLSFQDVIVESSNIMTVAFETTANGVYSALLFLATRPDTQERLYAEIVNIFPEKDFEMKFEDLEEVPYLSMVINETLRLAPSVPVISRQVTENTTLSKDLVLPKDLQIMIPIYHVHRRKDIWGPNANDFDPENFLPENIAGRHPYSYLPFSKGVRNCIGWRYAIFSMKVMLAGLVRNYRFTTSIKYEDIKFTWHIALKQLNEPLFRIYRRE